MSLHSFDPEIAARVGINAAVIHQNLKFWIEKNAANERHFHDGQYWTYNSIKAWEALFPYLTPSQIRTAINKLETDGLILSGNFNQSAYDRTKWYCILSQIHLSKIANGFDENGQPIPDIKPDIKPDLIKRDFEDFTDDLPPAKTEKAIRSTALPENWVPDITSAERLMRDLKLTQDEMNYCYQQMKGHAHAKNRKLTNWQQGYANWVRQAIQYGEIGPNSSSRRNRGTEDRFAGV